METKRQQINSGVQEGVFSVPLHGILVWQNVLLLNYLGEEFSSATAKSLKETRADLRPRS